MLRAAWIAACAAVVAAIATIVAAALSSSATAQTSQEEFLRERQEAIYGQVADQHIAVRASLRAYFFTVVEPGPPNSESAAEAEARSTLDAAVQDLEDREFQASLVASDATVESFNNLVQAHSDVRIEIASMGSMSGGGASEEVDRLLGRDGDLTRAFEAFKEAARKDIRR